MPLISPNKVNHSAVDTFEANKFIAHSTGLDLRPQNVNSLNIRIPVPAALAFQFPITGKQVRKFCINVRLK